MVDDQPHLIQQVAQTILSANVGVSDELYGRVISSIERILAMHKPSGVIMHAARIASVLNELPEIVPIDEATREAVLTGKLHELRDTQVMRLFLHASMLLSLHEVIHRERPDYWKDIIIRQAIDLPGVGERIDGDTLVPVTAGVAIDDSVEQRWTQGPVPLSQATWLAPSDPEALGETVSIYNQSITMDFTVIDKEGRTHLAIRLIGADEFQREEISIILLTEDEVEEERVICGVEYATPTLVTEISRDDLLSGNYYVRFQCERANTFAFHFQERVNPPKTSK